MLERPCASECCASFQTMCYILDAAKHNKIARFGVRRPLIVLFVLFSKRVQLIYNILYIIQYKFYVIIASFTHLTRYN